MQLHWKNHLKQFELDAAVKLGEEEGNLHTLTVPTFAKPANYNTGYVVTIIKYHSARFDIKNYSGLLTNY